MKNTIGLIFVLLLTSSLYGQRYLSEIFSPQNIEVDTGIIYGENYELVSPFNTSVVLKDLKLDIYQPKQLVDTVSERPLMIYLHTGDFIAPPTNGTPTGLKDDLTAIEICRQFARRGYVAASIYYRLNWNPLSLNPDIRKGTLLRAIFRAVIDAKTAVRFFRNDYSNNGNQYNINPNKVMIFGEGSGGYVALAHATLNKFSEIIMPKFLDANNQAVIDTNEIGNFDGFGGTNNYNNYIGINADVQFVVNIGGALADTSWLEQGDAPMVSFQCPRDPFSPYIGGTMVVPTTNEDVVDVQGAGVFMKKAVSIGNNNSFLSANLNDPISQLARSRYNKTVSFWGNAPAFTIGTNGDEGLYPFMLPLSQSQFENQAGPWQFWNPNSDLAQQMPLGSNLTTHEAALVSNPDMSRNKALNYIDTIQWYLQPRAILALGLDTTTTYWDPNAGVEDSTTFFSDTSTAANQYSLSGTITKGLSNIAQNAIVYLISKDSLSPTDIQLTLIDSQFTNQQGKYIFNIVDTGVYYLKAALNSNDSDFSNYLPTYFDVTLFWANSTSIALYNNLSNIKIALIGGNNSGGPGFISGNIFQGAGKNGQMTGAGNILIYLLDENENPLRYTYSNSSGYFEFSNLSYGTYIVYAEVLNKETESAEIIINSENESEEDLRFEIQLEKVVQIFGTGIKTFNNFTSVLLYPNPSKNNLIIDLSNDIDSNIEIIVVDYSGKQVLRKLPEYNVSNTYNIDVSMLNSGIYMMQIYSDKKIIHQNKLVISK